jgi:hypothetical protein
MSWTKTVQIRAKPVQMIATRIIAARDRTERAQRVVRETVLLLRLAGLKGHDALEAAGAFLGISPRRVRSHFKQELTRVREAEDNVLLDGFLRYLDDEASYLRTWADELERQRELLEMSGLCADGSTRCLPGGTSAPNSERCAALEEASAALQAARARRIAYDAARARAAR